MFDDLQRELRRLERVTEFQVPVEADAEGYLDKECPSDACRFQFKIHGEDWTELVSDEQVFCPLCGHAASSGSWWTQEQIADAEKQAIRHFQGRINDAMRRDAQRFNRKQPRKGLIRMSMEVKGTRGQRAVIPIPGREPLELRITCDQCRARSAVVGSAFFCPACGHSSAVRVFDDSLRKARLKVDASDLVRRQYRDMGARDDGEMLSRSLLETALVDCVVSFQRFCEQLYLSHPGTERLRPNVFQRLNDGSELWREVLGQGYDDWVSEVELSDLNVLFQRRHLLQHTEGMVDERYLRKSADKTYRVGQRIVVSRADVERIADLVETLAHELRGRIGSGGAADD